MSLRKFEAFLRKLARLLYDDELTPVVMDYLIRHQIVEPYCLSRQLQFQDKTSKGEQVLKKVLDRLEAHGFLVRQEVKTKSFGPELADRVKIKFEDIKYAEHKSTLSVYSFSIDLMLILKARIFTLRKEVI